MLLYVVRSLVNHPDDAEIILLSHPGGSIFCVHVDPGDVGKLMGNYGQTASALRCIAGASGRKAGRHPSLDIVQGASLAAIETCEPHEVLVDPRDTLSTPVSPVSSPCRSHLLLIGNVTLGSGGVLSCS
jgi:predicted RNA-binding protein YlqC (UPF0109 family)